MDSIQEWFQKGFELHKQGEFAQAQPFYQNIIQKNAKHFDALHLLGVSYYQLGQYQEAIEWITKANQILNTHPSAWNNLGVAYQSLHQHKAAYEAFVQAIKLKAEYPEAMNNIGSSAFFLGKIQEAFEWFEKALQLRPNFPDVFNNRALVLQELRRHADAIQNLQIACQLKTDYVEAYNNLGVSYHSTNQYHQALACYQKALSINPNYTDSYNNLGNTLRDIGQYQAALDAYDKALRLNPLHPDAHWNKSLSLLLMEDYQGGFELYEWRWKRQSKQKQLRNFPQPLWLGKEDLNGKTILLYGEQGLGDSIQFCRYTELVAKLGARVILEVPSQLIEIMQDLPYVDELITWGEPLPAFDYQCPLLSLPLAFQHFSKETIFAPSNYLQVSSAAKNKWQPWLDAIPSPKIGLVWSGSTIHLNDHNRSIPLSQFVKLFNLPVQWVSLQKEWRDSDTQWVTQQAYSQLHQATLHSFADTAAICEGLDLIISVDTSVAHLASAIGKPVWLILPFNPDWRWGLTASQTPWYPHMRLFRQSKMGDWQSVIDQIYQTLEVFCSNKTKF